MALETARHGDTSRAQQRAKAAHSAAWKLEAREELEPGRARVPKTKTGSTLKSQLRLGALWRSTGSTLFLLSASTGIYPLRIEGTKSSLIFTRAIEFVPGVHVLDHGMMMLDVAWER